MSLWCGPKGLAQWPRSGADMLDGELWINTGSPVKQEGKNNGRVFEIRDQGKVPSDEFIYGGRAASAAVSDGAYVEATEAGA